MRENKDGKLGHHMSANLRAVPRVTMNTPDVLKEVQRLQNNGDLSAAFSFLLKTIRDNNWKKSKLWWRLVPLMTSPDSYPLIRDLWLESPAICHSNVSILRAVARAAAVSGNHHDCRQLLRKLILLLSTKNRSPVVLRRKLRGAGTRITSFGQKRKANSDETTDFAAKAAVALVDLNNAFKALGVKTFLISGTLLGQTREGQIIGWDKDIDVGYFREECSIDLESHFMKSDLFRVGRIDFTSDRLRLIHQNGVWIDIFPHYMENGRRWHNGTATRWWNTPFGLRNINFIGIDQYIPDDPELYLTENYGDWRTPNPNFDARIDAPNVEIYDPDHFASLIYFSLEKSLREKKIIVKNRYIKILQKNGEGTWANQLL